MNRPIPWPAFDAEVALVRHLVHDRPWVRPGGEDDRALRAAFRRWSTADGEPTPLMLAPLWQHPAVCNNWHDLAEPDLDRAVHHAAFVLHLLALGLDPDDSGTPATNLGAAAKAAGVAEGRFVRLVNTPAPARLETLGRLFRRFRQQNVHLHLTSGKPDENEPDRRSTRATLRDLRRDDLAALLAFLFTDDPKRAVSRWAAGYYRMESTTESLADASADALTA